MRALLFILSLLVGIAGQAWAQRFPPLPQRAPTIESFYVPGWAVLDTLYGDITGDKLEDFVLVYQGLTQGRRRPLALAIIAETKTDYRLIDSSTVLLPPDENQPYRFYQENRPVVNGQTLYLDGPYLVYQTNLSGQATGSTTSLGFSYRDGRFVLTNYSIVSGDFKGGDESLDYDLSTGQGTYTPKGGKEQPFRQEPPPTLPGLSGVGNPETLLSDATLTRLGKSVIPASAPSLSGKPRRGS